ncbi:MAG: uracil-DNA glycosylase [Chitinophagaceae bacterium]|nr:uracil-DNA glycosylase [Chitinophagaceae bacterium]
MNVNIEASWKEQLQSEFEKPYFENIVHFLRREKKLGKVIYPAGQDIFNAFYYTPFHQVKVLLLGQDPYHGPGQAHGLCFSVLNGIKPPPSLVNIFKELQDDLRIPVPVHGELTTWAKQGVMMLNTSLTVEAQMPMSHAKIGWEEFTDAVIQKLSNEKHGIVFLLWGKFAQSKSSLIDSSKHLILTAAHPSPFSAYNGFFGCRHFSKTNAWLKSQGHKEIEWNIPD